MEGGCPPCKSQKGVGGSKGPWSVVTISPPLESQFLHMLCLYNFPCACVPWLLVWF